MDQSNLPIKKRKHFRLDLVFSTDLRTWRQVYTRGQWQAHLDLIKHRLEARTMSPHMLNDTERRALGV